MFPLYVTSECPILQIFLHPARVGTWGCILGGSFCGKILKKGEALSLNDPSGGISVKDDDMWYQHDPDLSSNLQ